MPLATRVGYTAFAVDGLVGAEVGLAITDAALVVIGGERLVVIAGDGTTRVVDNPEGFEGYSQGDSLAPIAAGAFLHFGRGDRLVAREVSSLATRFVYAYEWDSLYTPRVYASGDHFIVRTRTTWIGIDARSGVEVWRTPLTEPVHGIEAVLEAAGHGIVVEARRGFVLGLDASTGREIFRRASTFEEPGPIGPHGFGLRFMRGYASVLAPAYASAIATQPEYVETIIGLDGRERARIAPTDGLIARDGLEVGERSTTLLVGTEQGVVVRTYAHEGARMTWSAGPFARGTDLPSFARGGGRVVLASDPYTVRVLDAEGQEVWRGQPERPCRHVSMWTPAGAGAPWIVCRGFSNVTLYRPTAPAPRRRIHVSGTVRCQGDPLEEVVFIGGTRTETDAGGHYEADIVVDEELMIGSADHPGGARCGPDWRRVEIPPGATSVRVDLELSEWMGGLDGL